MKPSICIDFGAAYTKIAVRRTSDARSELLRHPSLNLDENHVCIPSVAAYRERDQRWIFGVDAADLKSGNGIHVFRNFKSEIFQPGGDLFRFPKEMETSARPTILEVAAQYFAWLSHDFLPQMVEEEIRREPYVYLCIPEFAMHSSWAGEFENLVGEAGWQAPVSLCISEPMANLTGALTQGRNGIRLNHEGIPSPDIELLFTDSQLLDFVERIREQGYVSNGEGQYSMLIIDIGAFTTDFGLICIDLETFGYFPVCEVDSADDGIFRLDRMVTKKLPEAKQLAIEQLSAADLERFRRVVYSESRPWQLGEMVIGEGDEGAMIQDTIGILGDRIAEKLEGFLSRNEVERIHEVILTGGGSNLPALSNRLARRLASYGVSAFHAANLTQVPVMSRAIALPQDVVRGASAIGGASVLFCM